MFDWSNQIDENVTFFKSFIEQVNGIVNTTHNATSLFFHECIKFKNEERNFSEISVKCINALDKVMSEFIKSIQEFDMIIQTLVKNNELLVHSNLLDNPNLFMDKQTSKIFHDHLKTASDMLYDDLEQLINQFLIILLPTTETVKAEKRQATKTPFIVRFLCSEALKVPDSTGITETNIMEEKQQSSFELHNKIPRRVLDCNEMMNFEFDLGLKKTVEIKDRPKTDKDNVVAAFRYYLHVYLNEFVWNNHKLKLFISTRAFVIISQTSQVVQAKATMSWLRFFGEAVEKPWNEFKNLLLDYYHANTGRHLTSTQINYLRHRFMLENDDSTITLNDLLTKKYSETPKQDAKDKLYKKNFTPWHWFAACINSSGTDKVKTYWEERLVYGFISKGYAEQILTNHDNGTFLIRFAESRIEASQSATPKANFTLAVKQQNKIYHLQDFLTFTELNNKNLDLYDTLNEIKIYKTGRKLVAHGKVVLNPIESNPLELKSFRDDDDNSDEELAGEDNYNAKKVKYEVLLRPIERYINFYPFKKLDNCLLFLLKNFRHRYTFIPECNGTLDGFEAPTPSVESLHSQNTPSPFFQDSSTEVEDEFQSTQSENTLPDNFPIFQCGQGESLGNVYLEQSYLEVQENAQLLSNLINTYLNDPDKTEYDFV
ncbi:DgyrCDS14808 [Dimorphilus gyrociliatus]|uniref:DgyrCDS14808 n=1 Tax=Dimorphilus gyrociliatus TaxID=2664684 RepID=A0A7I8WEZ1_9ANNE|nr:DgyrCDS14808 [Dimorphilus gyrociliatus]